MSSPLEIFACIGRMVEDIVVTQGKDPIQLELYRRLIEKTGPTNQNAIKKHIDAFNSWYEGNEESIKNKDFTRIEESSHISYSNNVYLPMRLILSRASEDEREILWKHIAAIRIKSVGVSEDLRQLLKGTPTQSGTNFIDSMMKDIEKEIGKINTMVENHKHALEKIETSPAMCSSDGCEVSRAYKCSEGCDWGLCEECFEKNLSNDPSEEINPMVAIEKLAATGGISRLMKRFSNQAESGKLNPMEIIGSLQGYSNSNGGPDMGSLLSSMGKGGMFGGGGKGGPSAKVEDLF